MELGRSRHRGLRAAAAWALLVPLASACAFIGRPLPGGGNSRAVPAGEGDVSAGGRFAVFTVREGLVPGDQNEVADIYLRDTATDMTELVSVSDAGAIAGGAAGSTQPSISDDGRFVAFTSDAPDLVPGDTNEATDVFVRDRQLGRTLRVSVAAGGGDANGNSRSPAISADGTHVAFVADASNLVPGDTNRTVDVFVHGLGSGTTTRVSVSSSGEQANGSSSGAPSISADGTEVAFTSRATNLVPGDTNAVSDIFVRSRPGGFTERVSLAANGDQSPAASQRPSISGDGRIVGFDTRAALVPGDTNGTDDVYVRRRLAGATDLMSILTDGTPINDGRSIDPDLNYDGTLVAFTSNTDLLFPEGSLGRDDVLLRDRVLDTTRKVSVEGFGAPGYGASFAPAISSDGRAIAFESDAPNFDGGSDFDSSVNVYMRQYEPVRTVLISRPSTREVNGTQDHPVLTANARYMVFDSPATNIVDREIFYTFTGIRQIYIRDNQTGVHRLVSTNLNNRAVNDHAVTPSPSGDGRYVAYATEATDVVNDSNGASDIMVRDLANTTTRRVSVPNAGGEANGASTAPSMSADGTKVLFISRATNLVAGDTNGVADAFLRDLAAGTTVRVSRAADGAQLTAPTTEAVLSADGRVAAFTTTAAATPGDANGVADVFARVLEAGTTERVSIDRDGGDPAGPSRQPSISADGGIVAFTSDADDLIAADANPGADVFIRSRTNSLTRIVSISSTLAPADGASARPSISADGRFVAFDSEAHFGIAAPDGTRQVFVRDRVEGSTMLASTDLLLQPAADHAREPAISGDGSYVAFTSAAANLDIEGDLNGISDAWVRFVHEVGPIRVSPAIATRGSSTRLTITGSGFRPGAEVRVSGEGAEVADVTVASGTTITFRLDLAPDAPLESRTVSVRNRGAEWQDMYGSARLCEQCVVVFPAG